MSSAVFAFIIMRVTFCNFMYLHNFLLIHASLLRNAASEEDLTLVRWPEARCSAGSHTWWAHWTHTHTPGRQWDLPLLADTGLTTHWRRGGASFLLDCSGFGSRGVHDDSRQTFKLSHLLTSASLQRDATQVYMQHVKLPLVHIKLIKNCFLYAGLNAFPPFATTESRPESRTNTLSLHCWVLW